MSAKKRVWMGGLLLVLTAAIALWAFSTFSGNDENGEASANGRGAGRPSGMRAPVETLVLRSRPLTRERFFNGSLTARESIEVRVERSGRVAAIHFQDGDQVKQGDLLVELDARELTAQLRAVGEELALAELNAERVSALFNANAITQRERDEAVSRRNVLLAEAETIRTRIGQMQVEAPFDGILGLRRVSPGALVDPGTVITTLDSIDPILVDFVAPEAARRNLSSGLPVRLRVAGFEEVFEGEVTLIVNRVDPATRTVVARAELPNVDGHLQPGVFASVSLETIDEKAIVVPAVAVVRGLADVSVFVVNGESAERRTVRTGIRRNDSVQILEGLSGGEEIVVLGTQQVRPGVGLNILKRAEQASEQDG